MPIINPLIGVKLVYILGITNVISLLLVMFSCRCCLGRRPSLANSKRYMNFYRYHCFYWWLLIASIFAHATIAFLAFGIPFFN